MPYRYYTAGSPVYTKSPVETWRDGFQATLNAEFYNRSSVYSILEESVFASGSFVAMDVIINRAVNSATGNKLGDDFKMLLFKNLDHSTGLGYKYYFDNNYWLVTNSEYYRGLAATCVVRRCNAVLRWVDGYGKTYTEPCVIDYEIKRARDEIGGKNPVTPQGFIDVYCQMNDNTRLIKGNQRFLFGSVQNRIAYRIFGDGLRSWINQETMDDESGRILLMTMGGNYVNEDTDDLVNGIADINKVSYALTISPSAIAGDVSDIFELVPYVTKNGNIVSENVNYITSSSSIASVSGSMITLEGVGSCTITGSLVNNENITYDVSIDVSGSAITNYEVRFSPPSGILLEGDTKEYTAYLYSNGVVQPDVFVFTVADANVPASSYTLSVVDGNSFSVTNDHYYLEYPLSIVATSGSHVEEVDIYLRGSW